MYGSAFFLHLKTRAESQSNSYFETEGVLNNYFCVNKTINVFVHH